MLYKMRNATADDLVQISSLDRLVFDNAGPTLEPAAPGEIEQGLRDGRVLVACEGDEVVGFLQWDVIGTSSLDLVSLAVRPDRQGTGVGKSLLGHFLSHLDVRDERMALSCVTSPQNIPMLRLLLRNEFTVTRAIRDYFGVGKDRFYLQFRVPGLEKDPDDIVVMPVTAQEHVFGLVASGDRVVCNVVVGAQGDFFELCRAPAQDRSALRANEASISVSESGSIVAGLTFILGLSFTNQEFSEPLRILLLFATILTVGALAIFANSSGNLARIRDDGFGEHMRWANLLLEFGGLYPLVIAITAVSLSMDSDSVNVSIFVGVLASLLLFAYEYSPFSLLARYSTPWYLHATVWAMCLLPMMFAPSVVAIGSEVPWVIAVGVVLALRFFLHLGDGRAESRRQWFLAQRHSRLKTQRAAGNQP